MAAWRTSRTWFSFFNSPSVCREICFLFYLVNSCHQRDQLLFQLWKAVSLWALRKHWWNAQCGCVKSTFSSDFSFPNIHQKQPKIKSRSIHFSFLVLFFFCVCASQPIGQPIGWQENGPGSGWVPYIFMDVWVGVSRSEGENSPTTALFTEMEHKNQKRRRIRWKKNNNKWCCTACRAGEWLMIEMEQVSRAHHYFGGHQTEKKVGHPPHSAQDIIGGVVEKNHQKIKFLAKFRAHCARSIYLITSPPIEWIKSLLFWVRLI